MINPVLFVSIIIMILVMAAVTVLAVISSAKKQDLLTAKLRNLSIVFLSYMVLGFLQFYFIEYLQNAQVDKIFGCLSDACYFLFLICWARIIMVFSANEKILAPGMMWTVTVIYGLLVEVIIVFAGKYTNLGGFTIEEPWRTVLMILNALYALWLTVVSLRYFFFASKHRKNTQAGNMTKLFSGLLLVYMIWTLGLDYRLVEEEGAKMSEIVLIDPLMVAYAALGGWIIYFFFKKDPLSLFAKEDQRQVEEKMQALIKEKNLTRRESEVLQLVCSGMNNPRIAEALCISENTVKRHLNKIFQKTGASNRYELISSVWEK